MSEKREHKRRYNLRLEYIAKFEKWIENEPPAFPVLEMDEMAGKPACLA